uniref:Putative ovule protein n=1 Tax=Solanum chacoense TaxID=4108 RepID=A0A0V0HK37_SOLCH
MRNFILRLRREWIVSWILYLHTSCHCFQYLWKWRKLDKLRRFLVSRQQRRPAFQLGQLKHYNLFLVNRMGITYQQNWFVFITVVRARFVACAHLH